MPPRGRSRTGSDGERRFRRASRRHSVSADWSAADGELIRDAIAAVSRDGGALRFGYTRDGGAYAIGILGDGEPYTEYVRPVDDIDEWLRDFVTDWNQLPLPEGDTPEPSS